MKNNVFILIGSTIMLKIVGWAGGAEGAGYGVGADPELQHILQQQKSRKRQTMALPIMGPGVVKVQWLMGFSLASLVMVSSSWSKISALNLPEILVRSLSMAVVTILLSGCWNSCPRLQVQSSHLECILISSLSLVVMMWSMVLM